MKQLYKECLKLNKNILLVFLTSLISQFMSTVIFMITVNLSVKFTRLYKDGS
jgi:hypothetical protein